MKVDKLKEGSKICPVCKEEYEFEDMHFAYDSERGKYCRISDKPIYKSDKK